MAENDLKCNECQKKCRSLKHLRKHKRILHGPQEFCEKCNKNFPVQLFIRHLDTVHPDDADLKATFISKKRIPSIKKKGRAYKSLKVSHSFVINKDGLFLDKTDRVFRSSIVTWNNFCELSYHEHQKPPTEDLFLDFLKKMKEAGKTTDAVLEYNRGLHRVYQYLYGVEFKSSKVTEYIEMVRKIDPDANIRNKGRWAKTYKKRDRSANIEKEPKHSFVINKDGLFLDKTDRIFKSSIATWNDFCELSYHEHQNPPTEDLFLDFLKKKKEMGRTTDRIMEYNRCLQRVYQYLYDVEFESSKVSQYIETMRTIDPDRNTVNKGKYKNDPGVCPHCGGVSEFSVLFFI